MTCDPKGKLDTVTKVSDAVITKCGVSMDISSQSFCTLGDVSALWTWIQHNRWVIFSALIVFGLFACFFGRKLFKVVLFLTAMIVVSFAGMFLCYSTFLYKEHQNWVGWTVLACWIVIGLLAGVLMLKLLRFGIFLLATWGGILLGQIIWTSFVYYSASQAVYWICIVAFGIIIGLLALKIEEHVLIFATSFTGAYMFHRGIAMVAPGWPNDMTLAKLVEDKRIDQIDPRFYAYLAGIVILTIIGIVVQYKQKKRDDENDRHPYTRFRSR